MMKLIIIVLILPAVASSQSFEQFKQLSHPENKVEYLNYNQFANQMSEMEDNYVSSYHVLENGGAALPLLDSTRIYQFSNTSDSILVDRTLLTYNATGGIKNKSNYFWNDYYKKMLNNNYEYIYDKTGKLKTITFNDWRFYHYDSVTPNVYLHLEGKNLMNYLSRYEYTYDQSGRQTIFSYLIYNNYLFNGENIYYWGTWAESKDFYDAAGIKVSSITGSHYDFLHKEEYCYDGNNNMIAITRYNKTSDFVWFYSGKIQYDYTYDQDFRVTSVLSSYWSFKADQWKYISKVDYSYHENGNLKSRIYSIIDTLRNELVPANRTDYKYNNIDKINIREDYDWNKTANAWALLKKQYYYYRFTDLPTNSNSNSLAKVVPFRIFPNPVKDILWIENGGNLNSVLQIYNNKGQCIKTDMMGKGINSINLSSFPRGIYFYKITLKEGMNSGKLIVE